MRVHKAGLVATVLLLAGCCSAQVEARDALLRQIHTNLTTKIAPRFVEATRADSTLLPEQKAADLGLMDDTVESIERVLQGAQ